MLVGIHRVLVEYGLFWLDIFTNSIGEKEVIDVNDTIKVSSFIESFGFSKVEEIVSKPKLYRGHKQKEKSFLFRRR